MGWTDNPAADAARVDRAYSRVLARLPRCMECGEPVSEGYGYRIGEALYCPDCQKAAWDAVKDTYCETVVSERST